MVLSFLRAGFAIVVVALLGIAIAALFGVLVAAGVGAYVWTRGLAG